MELNAWMGCGSVSKELEQFKHPKVDKNWDNWWLDSLYKYGYSDAGTNPEMSGTRKIL